MKPPVLLISHEINCLSVGVGLCLEVLEDERKIKQMWPQCDCRKSASFCLIGLSFAQKAWLMSIQRQRVWLGASRQGIITTESSMRGRGSVSISRTTEGAEHMQTAHKADNFKLEYRLRAHLFGPAVAVAIFMPVHSTAFAAEDDGARPPENTSAPVDEALEGQFIEDSATGTITYGATFITAQQGVISVADLVGRIPGGSAMLQGGNRERRGFSNGVDRILINGKRISGKSNDARTTLSQMAVNQVERIEVIRGSSPDIKVSSQDSLLNVVLKDDAGGSGAWNIRGQRPLRDDVFGLTGDLSWQDSTDRLDYSLSLGLRRMDQVDWQNTRLFDPQDKLMSTHEELPTVAFRRAEMRGQVTWHLANGDDINLNGMYAVTGREVNQPGDFQEFDALGNLDHAGSNLRFSDWQQQNWEVGGDYSTNISDSLELKLLALRTERSADSLFQEDLEIESNLIENDFRGLSDEGKTETIGRTSLVWALHDDHRLEVGTEVAVNTLDFGLRFYEREDGALVEQDVSASNVGIKETRDESFIIHSWQISENLSLDSTATFEWSKISQSGQINKSRTFTYLKPAADLRYNMTSVDQFQLSVRRNISQLEFLDFASSVSEDNEVVGGNENLSPERSWRMEASYERRLGDDSGSIKPTLFYEYFSNKLFQIETEPGLSGVGNVGAGKLYGLQMEASLRFGFVGLKDLQMTTRFALQKSELTDPFTGETVVFNHTPTTMEGSATLRYDVPKRGMAFVFNAYFDGDRYFRDIDEVTRIKRPLPHWSALRVEKQIFGDLVLSLGIVNLFDFDVGRTRKLWEDGRTSGQLTSFEDREASWTRRLEIGLKGTF